jgi:hypothetical protein
MKSFGTKLALSGNTGNFSNNWSKPIPTFFLLVTNRRIVAKITRNDPGMFRDEVFEVSFSASKGFKWYQIYYFGQLLLRNIIQENKAMVWTWRWTMVPTGLLAGRWLLHVPVSSCSDSHYRFRKESFTHGRKMTGMTSGRKHRNQSG